MSGVGITFDETHSFRDWGLKLKKIEIGIPKAKTEYVAFLAVSRTLGCLALTGSALSEHLVLRVKNGVNAKQRGSKPLYCLICK